MQQPKHQMLGTMVLSVRISMFWVLSESYQHFFEK